MYNFIFDIHFSSNFNHNVRLEKAATTHHVRNLKHEIIALAGGGGGMGGGGGAL